LKTATALTYNTFMYQKYEYYFYKMILSLLKYYFGIDLVL